MCFCFPFFAKKATSYDVLKANDDYEDWCNNTFRKSSSIVQHQVSMRRPPNTPNTSKDPE